jgi:hypothetical protein
MADKPIRSLTAKLLFDADLSEANRFQKKVDSIKGSAEKLKGSMQFKGGESSGLWGLLGLGGGKRKGGKLAKSPLKDFYDQFTGLKIPKPNEGLFSKFKEGFNEQLNATKKSLKDNAGKIAAGIGAAIAMALTGAVKSARKFADFELNLIDLIQSKESFGSEEKKRIQEFMKRMNKMTKGAVDPIQVLGSIRAGADVTSDLESILKLSEVAIKKSMASLKTPEQIASIMFEAVKSGDTSGLSSIGLGVTEDEAIKSQLDLQKNYGLKANMIRMISRTDKFSRETEESFKVGMNAAAREFDRFTNDVNKGMIWLGEGAIKFYRTAKDLVSGEDSKKENKRRRNEESKSKPKPGPISMKVGDINVNMKSTGSNQEDGKMIAKFIGSHIKTEMQKIIDYNIRHTDTQGSNAFDPPNIQAG